jgi:hypothetical protein
MNIGAERDQQGEAIDLSTPLSLRSAFRFPLQSATSRKELLWGAFLLLVLPGIGWLLNMGHRIVVVHRMQRGLPPWPAWRDYRQLLRHGVVTLGGMLYYYAPGLAAAWLSRRLQSSVMALCAAMLLIGATLAIPGFMSHYCRSFSAAEIYNPFRALSRCIQGGTLYWRTWLIALSGLAVSFVGLLGFGVAFLVTSVWFWQVAGFAFACTFTERFGLAEASRPDSELPERRPVGDNGV